MPNDHDTSNERLNAFLDGELDSEDKCRLLNECAKSKDLDMRLHQNRTLKEYVSLAYHDVPEPTSTTPTIQSTKAIMSWRRPALVASLVLCIGFSYLLFLTSKGDIDKEIFRVTSDNYILHAASGDRKQMRAILYKARQLLDDQHFWQSRRIEVITNEQGIDLLRSDVTPFSAEISALADKDVLFYACATAIKRLEQRGVEVHLVPEANTQFTALDRIVTRMQDDWSYIEI